MSSHNDDTLLLQGAYELLGIEIDATEAQIRTAYRKKSLQLHPDKVKDVPPDVAADRFHRLTLAYEELMNPTKRASLAESLQREREKRARRAAFDDRRRAMAADLEQREEQDRRARMEREQKQREREQRIVALREEGRALRIEKHERLLKEWQTRSLQSRQTASSQTPINQDDGLPAWMPNDTTVLIRFPTEQVLDMFGSEEIPETVLPSPLAEALAEAYGSVTSLQPKQSQKKRREVTVLTTFSHGVYAWRAVNEGAELRCTHPLLQDCWISWVDEAGKARADPPPRVAAWIQQGVTADKAPIQATVPHDRAPDFDYDYEARTLERIRAAAIATSA